MKDKKVKSISIRLPERNAEKIEYYSEKMGLSQNQLINKLVDVGLDDLRLLDSVGLLLIGKGLRDLVEKVRHGEIKLNGQGELPI